MSETREFTLFQPLYSDGRPIGNGNWKVWNGKAGEMPDYPNIEQVTVRELVPTPSLPDSQEREPDDIEWLEEHIRGFEALGGSMRVYAESVTPPLRRILARLARPEPSQEREPDGDLIGWASDEILEVRGHSTTPVTDALHVATKIIMAARKNLATRPEPTDVREALEELRRESKVGPHPDMDVGACERNEVWQAALTHAVRRISRAMVPGEADADWTELRRLVKAGHVDDAAEKARSMARRALTTATREEGCAS